MTDHFIYGCNLLSIQAAKNLVENKLGIILIERESLYLGIYFLYEQQNVKIIEIRSNADPFDNEPAIEKFASYPILLTFIQDGKESINLLRKLSSIGEFIKLQGDNF